MRLQTAALLFSAALSLPTNAMEPDIAAQHIKHAQRDLADGNWQLSLARFKWLLRETKPNAQLTVAYQNSINTILNENPLQFSFGATLLPSTNVSKGSSQSTFHTSFGTFHIDSSDERGSGIGVHLNTSATYNHAYSPGKILFITGLSGISYYSDEYLQQGHLGLTFGQEWLSAGRQSKLSFSFVDHVFRDKPDRDAPDYVSKGVSYSDYWNISNSHSLSIAASVKQLSYSERDYNDGFHSGLSVSPQFRINPQSSISLKLGYKRVNIEADHLSSRETALGLSFHRSERNGFSWSVGYERAWRDFDSRFPGVTYHRYDQVSDVNLSVSHRKIEVLGRTPKISCTLRDHYSNVALYDYNTVDCAVSLNYQF